MKLEIVSFDGNSTVNDGSNFSSFFPAKGISVLSSPKLTPAFLTRIGTFPALSSIAGKLRKFEISVYPVDQTTQPETDRDTLAKIFDPTDYSGDTKILIAKDTANSNKQWQLDCIVIGFDWDPTRKGAKAAKVMLVAVDPNWQAVNETTNSTWSVTSSGDTQAFTPGGNVPTLLYMEIKPTGARAGTGTLYRSFIEVINPQSKRFFRKSINLANSEAGNGLDTDALVTAGKMQADGDDLRIRVDGALRDRWLEDIDTTSTEIWVRLPLKPGITFTLATAIAGSGGIDTIDMVGTPANAKAFERLPQRGQVKIGTEYFRYRGKTDTNTEIPSTTGVTRQLLNIKRGRFGSSEAAHSVSDTVTWIQYRIWLEYGDTAATDPNSADADKLKPIFRLDSENDRFDYDDFASNSGSRANEWDSALKFIRPAEWVATGTPGETTVFTASAEANSDEPDFADPASVIGMQLRPVEDGNKYLRTRANMQWNIFHPAGFDTVTITGRIFATDKDNQWPKVLLRVSKDGENWKTIWAATAPASNSTWANHNKNASAESLGGTYRFVRLVMKGVIEASTTEHRALVQYSDIQLDLVAANFPSVSIGSEITSQTELKNVVIKNDTLNNEFVRIEGYAMNINDSLVIDGRENRIYLLEDNGEERQYLTTDKIRTDWLRFLGGESNTMSYTDVGLGNVTVTIKHFDRNN